MDDHEKVEEQVEDLDTTAQDAEEVHGGFSWGATQGLNFSKLEPGAQKVQPGNLRGGPGGVEHQHNEILVRI
jgi:hypothetical protein